MKTIRGVTIGDRFRDGKHITKVVVDFYEVRSVTTGVVIKYQCIARADRGLSNNLHEVCFVTVQRNKIPPNES
jgi:hypothetical protein